MIVTTNVFISPDGKIRIARTNGKPMKGEVAVTLRLDVPDSAFNPPALSMTATVANAATVTAMPITSKGGGEWMAADFIALRAAAGMSQEEFARAAGVSLGIVREWERATHPVTPSGAIHKRLSDLKAAATAEATA